MAETAEKDEAEYLEKDVIQKFRIDYDHSFCLSDKFPEVFHIDADMAIESQQHVSFAPGEGKLPGNILSSENWDALAFPMKHPDGKTNLHQKREVKLRDQYYVAQCLRKKDSRFRKDPVYTEKKQLQRNINLSFRRRKKVSFVGKEESSYVLEAGF